MMTIMMKIVTPSRWSLKCSDRNRLLSHMTPARLTSTVQPSRTVSTVLSAIRNRK